MKILFTSASGGMEIIMMNYIWGFMIIFSLASAAFGGKLPEVSSGALEGAAEGVNMTIKLCGIMCLWTGLMEIAKESGLLKIFARFLRPVTKFLFPKLSQGSPALHAVVMNITANILGMSNAATPMGITAMEELRKENGKNAKASDSMCMFIILNTMSIQLIPATIIAMRKAAGSSEPTEITVPVWITSLAALTVGILAAKILERKKKI